MEQLNKLIYNMALCASEVIYKYFDEVSVKYIARRDIHRYIYGLHAYVRTYIHTHAHTSTLLGKYVHGQTVTVKQSTSAQQ